MPFEWYPTVPKTDCIKRPTRFVPLAMLGGKPENIRIGKVKREPPPARVFMIPDIAPEMKIMIYK